MMPSQDIGNGFAVLGELFFAALLIFVAGAAAGAAIMWFLFGAMYIAGVPGITIAVGIVGTIIGITIGRLGPW